jgi:1-acyl-sn-glycerol-3-phosphate acyltransferase
MILEAKHHIIVYSFFKWYSAWIIKRNFSSIHLDGEFHDRKKAVLLISNHISWWDGFWTLYLCMKVLHRKFHFMMLEEQLRKRWLFTYTGGFSVSRNKKSIIESINYTSFLLNNPKNMVLMFPQGKINSMHKHSFQFQKGIERIVKGKDNLIQVLFSANLIDYHSEKKPALYSYIREYSGEYKLENLQKGYNDFYSECIECQSNLNKS